MSEKLKFRLALGTIAVLLGLCSWALVVLLQLPPTETAKAPPATTQSKFKPADEKADKTAAKVKPANLPAEPTWPAKARFAVVSADGSTVAFMIDRQIVVARNGKEAFRILNVKTLHPQMVFNADGSRLAVYWLAKRSVALWDTAAPKQLSLTAAADRDFTFSDDGSSLLLDEGALAVPTGVKTGPATTSATVSDDGRIVAVTSKSSAAKIYASGKLLAELSGLEKLQLNRDGSRLLAYDPARKVVVLRDLMTGKELKTHDATGDAVYHFSPGGQSYGYMEPGADKLALRYSWSGSEQVTLPATYSFRIGGGSHTIKYTLKAFHFYAVEPTDVNLTVTMLTKTKEELGTKMDHDGSVQWAADGNYWRNSNIVHASLDQAFDFDEAGNLTKHALNP